MKHSETEATNMYDQFMSNQADEHFFIYHLNYYLILFHYFSATYKLDFQNILSSFKKFMLESHSNDLFIRVSFAKAKKLGLNDLDYHASVLYAFFHFHKTGSEDINYETWQQIAVQIIDWECQQVVVRALNFNGSENIKLIRIKRNEQIEYLNDTQIKLNIKHHLDNVHTFLTANNAQMKNTIFNYYNNYLPAFSIDKTEKKEIEQTLNYLYKFSLHTQKKSAV